MRAFIPSETALVLGGGGATCLIYDVCQINWGTIRSWIR